MKKQYKTIDEVEIEVLKASENMRKSNIKLFIFAFAFVILMLISMFLLANNSNSMVTTDIISSYMFLILMVVAVIVIIVYLIQNSKKKVVNRTYIIIPYKNKTKEELDNIIKNTLEKLLYKEKKYSDELVYYSYKTSVYNNGLHIKSLPRYIKYNISNENVEIEAWFSKGAKEFSIDSKTYGLYIKEALLMDLKFIFNSVNYKESSEINEQ